MLTNPSFECSAGIADLAAPQGGTMKIPVGWTVTFINGTPWVYSASMHFNNGNCGGGAHVEKIEGNDSIVVFAHDLEWTDQPGKPFDVSVHQQVQVTPGKQYCLSAWLLTLCGGSTMPNDCPEGFYMAKMIGLDPTGGTDPRAASVVWSEDRRNFVSRDGQRIGWAQMTVTAQAQAGTMTVFGRINSPFRWHGNHGFIDGFKLVEAPALALTVPQRVDGQSATVAWGGAQGAMIDSIPAGTFRPLYDLQFRQGAEGAWQNWQAGVPGGQAALTTSASTETTYFVRGRMRSEQPPAPPIGSSPNHRFASLWSQPAPLVFNRQAPIFMPPPPVPAPPAPPAPTPIPVVAPPVLSREQKLVQVAAQKQVIQFNPDAALQKVIFAHGFVPNSGEFDIDLDGQAHIGQRAENLASGEVRVYFVRVGDWGNVQFVTAPRSGGTREAPPSPPQQMA
ncbi:MAG: hypothetical protein KBG20_03190 [Caldilineaceae bacterium]|nr:hypothetical protein [Caldilineaceae bacterium]MBP8107704.1 hypothetical protein [Caldilineaceae bacterium]MBP9071271.1 hypothetical protein [Caldilineaceae bacterium]